MALEDLLYKCAKTQGILHKAAIAELRTYLKSVSPRLIEVEIMGIKDVDLLRYLWEAGLPTELQTAVFRKLGARGYAF
jgi:hypothetical protein